MHHARWKRNPRGMSIALDMSLSISAMDMPSSCCFASAKSRIESCLCEEVTLAVSRNQRRFASYSEFAMGYRGTKSRFQVSGVGCQASGEFLRLSLFPTLAFRIAKFFPTFGAVSDLL